MTLHRPELGRRKQSRRARWERGRLATSTRPALAEGIAKVCATTAGQVAQR